MKITKRGTVKETTYRGRCPGCDCEFEVDADELSRSVRRSTDSRDLTCNLMECPEPRCERLVHMHLIVREVAGTPTVGPQGGSGTAPPRHYSADHGEEHR